MVSTSSSASNGFAMNLWKPEISTVYDRRYFVDEKPALIERRYSKSWNT